MNKFILFDAIQEEIINKAKLINSTHSSLLRSQNNDEEFAESTPYLFTFENVSDFENWIILNVWGHSIEIFIETLATFDELFKHFRRFLTIQDEQGKKMYFRFYDPHVLKIFLPTCDDKQIIEFFGPVESFIVEGDTKEEAIRFSHLNGTLKQEIVPIEIVFGEAIKTTEIKQK